MAHDGGVEQPVAESEQGVEPVQRGPASPRGIAKALGDRGREELCQPSKIADGRRAFEAPERIAVGGRVDPLQGVAEGDEVGEHRVAGLGVAA